MLSYTRRRIGVESVHHLQKQISFISTKLVVLSFLAIFSLSLLVGFLSPFIPKTEAAAANNFAMFVGEAGDQQRSVADAINGKDSYGDAGWSNMRVFVKDFAGTGQATLEFDRDLTKQMGCNLGQGCDKWEPVFTKKLYCTLPNQKFTLTKPATTSEFYEITYAVGLEDNETNGDKFVKQGTFRAIGGYLITKKYAKPDPRSSYTRAVVTRDQSVKGLGPRQLDDGDRPGSDADAGAARDAGAFGVYDNDAGCRPPAPLLGEMDIKNWAALSNTERNAINPSGVTSGSPAATGGGEEKDDCDTKLKDMLSWIVCPVVDGANKAVVQMENAINRLMTIDTDRIFGSTQYKDTWTAFRGIALGIIIISALIVIIGTAFGYEILDAYTIRKTLPRLLIAMVFIALSWDILEFLVGFSNDIGNGIRALIYMPFGSTLTDFQLDNSGTDGGSADFEAAQGTVLTAMIMSMLLLGPLGILSFGLTALLSVVVAFLTLVVRELIIVFLVIIAPIGIALMILPNTRKGWEIWQKFLVSMLVAFPIIAGMIAIGHAFSITTYNNGNANWIEQLIAYTAYILPYFMLPFAFRLAGGLMSTLTGMASDRSRGVFDRLKKQRGDAINRNIGEMKAGNRLQGNKLIPGSNTAARLFNTGTARAGTGINGRFGFGVRGAQAMDQNTRMNAEQLAKDPRQMAIKDDDGALRAQTYRNSTEAMTGMTDYYRQQGHGAAAAQEQATRAVRAVQASTGFGRPQAFLAAQQMVDTGTAFHDIEDLSTTLGRAGDNESTVTSLAGYANSVAKAKGRHDLAPGFGLLDRLSRGEHASQRGRGAGPGRGAYRTARQAAWESGSLYQHANDKPANTQAAIAHFEDLMNDPGSTYADKENAAVGFNELKAMMPNSSGAVQNEIQAALDRNQHAVDSFHNAPQPAPNQLPTTTRTVTELERDLAGRPIPDATVPGGYRQRQRLESTKERVERRSRTYERPNPNHM